MNHTVKLSPSGHSFHVEEGETILDAAMRQNTYLPYGCRNGLCGSCKAGLLSGEVTYPEGQPGAFKKEEDDESNVCFPCKAQAMTDIILEAREVQTAAAIAPKILPVRVTEINHLAHDVIQIHLKLPDSQRLQFLAGQYLECLLPGSNPRAFSIANAPHDDKSIELHIRHVDGGKFTDWAFSQMEEKAILRIKAPLGAFTLLETSTRPMIFVGGGTGFAPLKGQIEHAFHEGMDRPMTLYWGVRSRRDLYMPELPEHWADTHDQFTFIPVLSEPDDDWQGRGGWVHEAVIEDFPDLSGHDVYMAGPPPMIIAARKALRGAGLKDKQMFYDSFEYAATEDD